MLKFFILLFKKKHVNFLFPFTTLYKATNVINNKIEKLSKSTPEKPYKYEYASADNRLKKEVLLNVLKETIEGKKTLEDKAKSSLIAITISATLIFSIIKFMQDIDDSIGMQILLAIVSFLSLFYMVIAGILSLYSIGEINRISIMYPEDYLLENEEMRVQIADNIENNYLYNLKRNNFMTTSYKCMITSISFLILIFIVSTAISFQSHMKREETNSLNTKIENVIYMISTISDEYLIQKRRFEDIQQTLIKIVKDNNNMKNELNTLSTYVENISEFNNEIANKTLSEIMESLLEIEQMIESKNNLGP